MYIQNETEEWLDPESNSTSLWITSRLDNLYGQPVFRVRYRRHTHIHKENKRNCSSYYYFFLLFKFFSGDTWVLLFYTMHESLLFSLFQFRDSVCCTCNNHYDPGSVA